LGEVGNTGIGTGPHLHVEYIKTDNPVNIFGKNKIACRYSPMAVEDLQNIVDRKEVQNVEFLDGHSEKLGGIEITPLRDCFFNPMPEPKASERLQESRLPIVKTLGDILKIVGL
jgi:murein DD-endopeptidase MepM/ murein hydrolase activator NlpD